MEIYGEQPAIRAELEALRNCCEGLGQRISRIEAASQRDAPARITLSEEKLAVIASSIYRARRRRLKMFEASLFGEPAWDMLLDLFIKKARGERVSTTSLCLAGEVPATTGLRWIQVLEKQGLLRRLVAPDDARVILIEMTTEGYRLMRAYVAEGISKFEMPLPD